MRDEMEDEYNVIEDKIWIIPLQNEIRIIYDNIASNNFTRGMKDETENKRPIKLEYYKFECNLNGIESGGNQR